MDEKPLTLEGVRDAVKESHSQQEATIKREIDSLDDFEHLGHDSSPLKDVIKTGTGDMLSDLQTEPRDLLGEINTRVEKAATSTVNTVTDQLSSFDPEKSVENLLDKPLLQPTKMDSNLLDMGDSFPDRKEGDEKLDKFLQEMSAPFAPATKPQEKAVEEKYNFDNYMASTKNFMDNERELIQPVKIQSNDDILDRYSDSEPDDDFKPSKYEDFPKKNELPESFGSTENFKSETFKDVVDEPEPEIPKKDYPVVRPTAPAPDPPKPVLTINTGVTRVEEKSPEEKVPEPVITPPKKVEEKVVICEKKPKVTHTDAEAIFCKMGLDAWFNPERLNPQVESLIYWRDPKKSGPVFGGVLLVLLALTYFSLISVVAYLSLLALTGTIAFRIYKNIIQAVQKTGDGHPFKDLLEFDVSLPQDKVKEISEVAVVHINAAVIELRRLFLVEDLVDSIKFGVLLWTLTYLGAWFNGMTLIIIAWVALFTLPKVYETNKTQIDANLEIVRTKLADITSKVKAAIPIGKKGDDNKKEQ